MSGISFAITMLSKKSVSSPKKEQNEQIHGERSKKKSVGRARDTNETVNNSKCIYITSGNE